MTRIQRNDGGIFYYCITLKKGRKEDINNELETLLSNKRSLDKVISTLNREWENKAKIEEARLVGYYLMLRVSYNESHRFHFLNNDEDYKKQIGKKLLETFKLPIEQSSFQIDEIDGFYWDENERRLYIVK